jgi:predicted metal-binding protein
MQNKPKTYNVPWNGQLFLACRKCQRKLKGDAELGQLAKLKKTIKRRNKEHPEQVLHVLNVPCMDLCPKGGVTVCNPVKIPNRLSILRSEEDIDVMLG